MGVDFLGVEKILLSAGEFNWKPNFKKFKMRKLKSRPGEIETQIKFNYICVSIDSKKSEEKVVFKQFFKVLLRKGA